MKRLQAVTAEVWHAVKSSAEDVPDELRVLFAMLQRKAASYEQIFYIYGAGITNKAGIRIEASKEKLEVIEDGDTFHENALLKAKAYFDKFGKPKITRNSQDRTQTIFRNTL